MALKSAAFSKILFALHRQRFACVIENVCYSRCMSNQALERAIAIVGSQDALAKRIGVAQRSVGYWLRQSKKGVPAEYADAIEQATDGAVLKSDIRPDIFKQTERA